MSTSTTKTTTLEIDPLKQGRIRLRIIGRTPLYFNSMSAKVMRDLIIGTPKKTAAEKAAQMKHNPEQEFWDSTVRLSDGPTFLGFPAPAIKAAMATAALETPNVTKTSVKRLVFLPQSHIPIWGLPYMKMDVVRSADMNRTPDVRTRAYLPRWCSEFDIAYVNPPLNASSIVSLVANAGVIVGIGDFRQEKGAGSHGTFQVTTAEDTTFQDEWDEIVAEGSREAQEEAMKNPVPFDDITDELLEAVRFERQRRAA